jgi:hypothetical protein
MRLVIESASKLYQGRVWGLKGFTLTLEPGVLGPLPPTHNARLDERYPGPDSYQP